MFGLPTAAFRVVGQDDAILDGFVVPFYLSDRKLRISVTSWGQPKRRLGRLKKLVAAGIRPRSRMRPSS